MKLSDIIVPEAVIADLNAATRDEAIEKLVEALVAAGSISRKAAKDVIGGALAREAQATTGIGKGIALPHAKLKGLKKVACAIGRSPGGIDFNALDSRPAYIVILEVANPDNPDEHLQAMETIFKHVQRDMFRKFLRQSETSQAIWDLIQEADELA